METYERLYPEELAAAKAYMRLEGSEEDALVMGMVLAARAYLAGAGVALPAAGSGRRALYDRACHSLALTYYERRGAGGAAPEDDGAVQRIILSGQRKRVIPIPTPERRETMEIIRGPDAGELDQRVSLLAFRSLRCCGGRTLCAPMENKCGACAGEGWKWSEYRKAWARVTPTGGGIYPPTAGLYLA